MSAMPGTFATFCANSLISVVSVSGSGPSRLAPPFKVVITEILYGEGISREGEIIELGVKHGIVEKSGAWYAYNKDKIGQGKDNAREFLREHADIAVEIENRVREAVGVAALGTAETAKGTVYVCTAPAPTR